MDPRTQQDSQDSPKAVIHVDLDGAEAIFRANQRTYTHADDPLFETGLTNLLDLFDRFGIKATLFTIAADMENPRKRELIEEAVRRGHEIASHSVTHPQLNTLDSEQKRHEISVSKDRLEAALNVSVMGFRAPSYSIDRECMDLLMEYSYAWDSSVFPDADFAARIGVNQIPDRPHHPYEGRSLMELPLPAYRPRPFPFHPCYSLMLGFWYFRSGLRRFRKTNQTLISLFHLTDTAEPLPKDRLDGMKIKLMTLSHLRKETKIDRCTRMLETIKNHYNLTTTANLLAH